MAPPTPPALDGRPSFEPRESEHPALHPSITNVPVTPGFGLHEEKEQKQSNSLPFDPAAASPGPTRGNKGSYFPNQQQEDGAGSSGAAGHGGQSHIDYSGTGDDDGAGNANAATGTQ